MLCKEPKIEFVRAFNALDSFRYYTAGKINIEDMPEEYVEFLLGNHYIEKCTTPGRRPFVLTPEGKQRYNGLKSTIFRK